MLCRKMNAMRTRAAAFAVAAALTASFVVAGPSRADQDKPWAFVAVTDPEPHSAPTEKNPLAPFADDLRYLKDTFITKATAQRPKPELVIVPGDIAPVEFTAKTFREVLGEELPWLPVPGNHDQSPGEAGKLSGILAGYKKLGLQFGPAGSGGLQYHFTYRNVLFAGLDIYWNGQSRDGSEILANGLSEEGLQWVRQMLAASNARYKIVYGHRPAFPFGRHADEPLANSLDLRDRFWKTLADNGCQLYLCGHTHSYNAYRWLGNADPNRWHGHTSKIIPDPLGVWEINVGSVRGMGSAYDRSVLYFRVTDRAIQVEAHIWPRSAGKQGRYEVPPDTDQLPYRLEVYPDLKENLKPPRKSGASAPASPLGVRRQILRSPP